MRSRRRGTDFAKGSRFMQGGGSSDLEFHRYFGNQVLVWAVRLLFGCAYTSLESKQAQALQQRYARLYRDDFTAYLHSI